MSFTLSPQTIYGEIRKKIFKRILVFSLAFLAIAFIAVQVFLRIYLEPLIRHKVERLIVSGSDSLYSVEIDKLSFNVFTGNLKLKDVKIKIDSARFYELRDMKSLPSVTIDVEMHSGMVTGIKVLLLLFSRELRADDLRTTDADIIFHHHFRHADVKTKKKPLWKLIQPDIKNVSVNDVFLENVRFSYISAGSSNSFVWKFDSCFAAINDIRIDSASSADTTRLIFAQKVMLRLENARFQTADSLIKKISVQDGEILFVGFLFCFF